MQIVRIVLGRYEPAPVVDGRQTDPASEVLPHHHPGVESHPGRDLLDAQRASWTQFSAAMTTLLDDTTHSKKLRMIGDAR